MYTVPAIRFGISDPTYKVRSCAAVVPLSQIVKVIPRYHQFDDKGRPFQCTEDLARDELGLLKEGFGASFLVFDALGNEYHSSTATEEAQQIIETIFNGAV